MKVTVNDTTLYDIANAIREKDGSLNSYYPADMGDAIRNLPSGGGDNEPTDEELTYSGDCSNAFKAQSWLIDRYGDRITTKGIANAQYMFRDCESSNIPFVLNFLNTSVGVNIGYMFYGAKIESAPTFNDCKPSDATNLFSNCYRLVSVSDDFVDSIDWSKVDGATSQYGGYLTSPFKFCYCLRSFPMKLLSHGNPNIAASYANFKECFDTCYVLDEIVDLPNPHTNATWTSNALGNIVQYNFRLKNFTFALPNGEPYTVKWKSQIIDLSTVGGDFQWNGNEIDYALRQSKIVNVCGISADKLVYDDATYQALKDDPDWFTFKIAYSRYNHDSAVATINSLPDASAYLASSGGTNTIKFKGAAGSATDGGAINTLTEEEIAVATSRGWTVTIS